MSKIDLLVAYNPTKTVLKYKFFTMELADMVALIDWHNSDEHDVLENIERVAYEEVEIYGLFTHDKDLYTDQKHQAECVEAIGLSRFGEINTYFVDLINWNKRPPRKMRNHRGRILRLAYLKADDIFSGEDAEFTVLVSHSLFLVRDGQESDLESIKRRAGIGNGITFNKPRILADSESLINYFINDDGDDDELKVTYDKEQEEFLKEVLSESPRAYHQAFED